MHAGTAGFHQLDLVDHLHATADGTEHAVAPTLHRLVLVIQIVVIGHVDEELRRCGVRVAGAGHRQGTNLVGQAVVGFVLDSLAGIFFNKARQVAAALNHEVVDHAMEQGAIVVTVAAVLLEVGTGDRRLVMKQFDLDIAVIGMQRNHQSVLALQ